MLIATIAASLLVCALQPPPARGFVHNPKIITTDGHLILEAGLNRNITFRLGGDSRLTINDELDVMDLLIRRTNQRGPPRPEQWAVEVAAGQTRLAELSSTVDSLKDIVRHRLEPRLGRLQNRSRSANSQQQRMQRRLVEVELRMRELVQRLERDNCRSNPCQNGGSCYSKYGDYMCKCGQNFEGDNCENDVNECALFRGTTLGCQNGAQCVNQFGGYSCLCGPGWFGIHCTQRKGDCSQASSWELCGHGFCVGSGNSFGYQCVCEQGWKTNGLTPPCTVDIDECAESQPHCATRCVNLPGSFMCAPCPAGLSGNGIACRDIDECATNNGGCSKTPHVPCFNVYGAHHCGDCPLGWVGDGRTCARSRLDPSSQGASCATASVCHPEATCREISNTVVCTCPPGKIGTGIGPNGCLPGTSRRCDAAPCVNGGICFDNARGYTCVCPAGFSGPHCAAVASVCSPNPCHNNGRCRPTGSRQFQCQCPSGYRGRLCDTTTSRCGGLLYGRVGRLKYPEGSLYDHNAQCAWVIRTDEASVLNVTFSAFDLEDATECRFDFLQINDGRTAAAQVIGRFCSSRKPLGGNIISTTNNLYLWFKSDNSTAKEGFDLEWTSVPPQCGGLIEVESHGTIATPGSPGNYPKNRDCQWQLRAANDKRLKLIFFTLQIEIHDTCNYDYVEIRDTVSGSVLEKFCNSSRPSPLLLPTNEATILFHSDNVGGDAGFQIYYSTEERVAGCGGTFLLKEGAIASPTAAGGSGQISCEYDIRMAVGESVRIEVQKFEMGQDDCLEFYDVDVERKIHSLQGKFCGGYGSPPVMLQSAYNAMQIRYTSTGGSSSFALTYKAECSYTFESDSDEIQSPQYPLLVSAERFCAYKINTEPSTVISVSVVDFQLNDEDDPNGEGIYTSLTINDGLDRSIMGPYCGNNTPPSEFVSKTNLLVVNLQLSAKGSGRGFKLRYRAVPIGKTDCGGVFTKPGYTIRTPSDDEGKYMHDLECYWIIVAPPGKGIVLNWRSFSLETSSDCSYDYVEIYDTLYVSGTDQRLGRFCEMPPSFVSYARAITIKFVSDFSESKGGFLASYEFVEKNACGGEILSSTGEILTPEWPKNYSDSADCRWTITAPLGTQIQLKVHLFELEDSPDCDADFLEIRNGGSDRSPLIGTFCGTTIPQVIPSFTNQLRLHFHSDSFVSARGFRLEWYVFSNGCGGVLKGEQGVVTSPLYPNSYPHNANCEWQIYVPKGSAITLLVEDLELETLMSCSYDHLDIFDGHTDADALLGRICEQSPNDKKRFQTNGNEALLRFQTDGSSSDRGFLVSYAANCTRTLTAMYGVIESPNFGRPHPGGDIDCLWTIRAPRGNRIALEFTFYESTDGGARVYVNETAANGSVKAHAVKDSITSTGDTLAIGQNSSAVSFRLEYSMIGCIEVFHRDSGDFHSPDYPKAYPNDVECFWEIKTEPGKGIELSVRDMDIEESANCTKDALLISNHLHSNNYKERHCGKQQDLVFTSSAHRMYVRFMSNADHNGKGFTASYRTLDSQCGGVLSSRNGVIQSPNYPHNYPPNADCEWTIEVKAHHSITLTLDELDLESSFLSECEFDYVEAVETLEDSETERRIFQKCSDHLAEGAEWKSKTNAVTVRFKSDDSFEKKGFRLSFREDCGEHITLDENTFSVLNLERSSSSNVTCQWVLAAKDPAKHVSLTVTHVQLTEVAAMVQTTEADCLESGVKIFDGVDDSAPLRSKFCKSHPPAITSNGHALTVNVPLQTIGEFDAFYFLMNSYCGGSFDAISGKLSSPSYPESYPVNVNCDWFVEASAGNSIVLTIESMDLEESEGCNNDYLEVRADDERGRLLGLFCGSTVPPPIDGASSLWIRFSSDGDNVKEGFFASYNYAMHNELNGTEGVIESPKYPSRFHSNEPYTWRVTVDKEYVVLVTVKHAIDVNTAHVKFFDGYSDIGAEIDYSETHVVRSHTNIVLLKAWRGPFRFEWQRLSKEAVRSNRTAEEMAQSCGQSVIAINSTLLFSSPGYPHGYAANLDCNWTLVAQNPAEHTVVQFSKIELESSDCFADYALVWASSDLQSWTQLDKLCKMPTNVLKEYSGTPFLKLQFVTDASVNKTGFSAYVRPKCGALLTGRSGLVNATAMTASLRSYEVNCTWTIRVRQSRRIRITFVESYLTNENGSANCRAYFTVRNGLDEFSPFLGKGRYCENNITDVLETSSNRAHVKFARSGFPRFRAAFHYEEISHQCSDDIVLSEESSLDRLRVITSPNYPNIANPHSECVWKISAPIHHVITVDFEGVFDLAPASGGDCEREYVQVNDGSTELMPLLGRFCGKTKPNSLTSTGNVLRLKYFTDIAEPHAGFRASVSIGRCGGSYYAPEGSISSPRNLPQQVPAGFECVYTINTEVGSTIRLDVERLVLPSAANCSDVTHLELTEVELLAEGDNVTDTLTICGATAKQYIVETNKLIVRYKVKAPSAQGGDLFKINYSAIGSRCGETIVASIGILQTPGYPNGVRKPTHCIWRLLAPKGKRIKIEFLDFDTGARINATSFVGYPRTYFRGRISFANDFQMQSLIARISDNPPAVLYSTDNTMAVDAFLLAFSQHRGFKLRFTAAEDSALCRSSRQVPVFRLQGSNETDTYCSYELPVAPNETLALHVDTFEPFERPFYSPMLCSLTGPLRLEVAQPSSERLLQQLLCGNDTHPTVRLPFPAKLSLLGNRRNRLREISVSYETYRCGGILPVEHNHVTISRPSRSAGLGRLECAWAVWPYYDADYPDQAEDYMNGAQIEVSLAVDLAGSCDDEFLLVYNGPNQNAPHLGRYCQQASAGNLVVERGLFVEYHAAAFSNRSAFNVTMRLGSGCGGHIAYPYRDIDFRDQYGNNVECVWEIATTAGFHVGLSFVDRFFIESSAGCRKDSLRVQQGTASGGWTDVATLCGREPPAAINTTTDRMRLIFRSDNDTLGDGFTAHFERNCGGLLYASHEPRLFHSPGYPLSYEPLLNCNYTIVALDNSSAVDVRFRDFALEEPPMAVCMFDNVTIFMDDGDSDSGMAGGGGSSRKRAVLCGVKSNREYRAKKSISLILRTDATFAAKGFLAEYSTNVCGGVVANSSVVESPHQHDDANLPPSSSCYWNLTAPPGHKIHLKFEHIDFEGSVQCSFDGVEIFKGLLPLDEQRLGKFCGNLTGTLPVLNIPSNTALLHSYSDSRDPSRGFRVLVDFLPDCDAHIFVGRDNATYNFDRYGGSYADNADCTYVFASEPDRQLQVEFLTFHLEESAGCQDDFVEVRDGVGAFADAMGRFCGHAPPPKLVSSRNALYLRFVSDADVHSTGFIARIRSLPLLCGQALVQVAANETVTLRSPALAAGVYPRNAKCFWKLKSDSTMHLQFTKMDIARNPALNGSCGGSYLKMHNIEDDAAIEKGLGSETIISGATTRLAIFNYANEHVYCGNQLPDDYFSSSKQLLVRFQSDGDSTLHTGFSLKVSAVKGCFRNFTGTQGRVSVTDTQDHCDIFINAPQNYSLSLYFADLAFVTYDCNEEYLEVFDARSNASLAKLCTYVEPGKSVFTDASRLRLRLKMASYYTRFDLTYVASRDGGPGCGGDLFNTEGIFTSPFYPNNVRNNSDCRWNIRVPSNVHVLLRFLIFNMGAKTTCHSDYVQIIEHKDDGSETVARQFCGEDEPAAYKSQGSYVSVRFHKTVNYDGTGWVLKFNGVPSNYNERLAPPYAILW